MIATSFDGQWATVRRGREVLLLERGSSPAVGQLELETEDADVVLVGPPNVLCVIYRGAEPRVVLHAPPYLEVAARVDLEQPMKLAAVTGSRMVLTSADDLSLMASLSLPKNRFSRNGDPNVPLY